MALAAEGVPEMVARPEPVAPATNVTPGGNPPDSEMVGSGTPLAVTLKVKALPALKVVDAALVKTGAWPTTMVNVCVALGVTPLAAVSAKVVVPTTVGIPVIVAVPFELAVKVSPLGGVPMSLTVAVGTPVVVTLNVPLVLTVKYAVVALVIAGAWSFVNTKDCVTVFAALTAVIVMGKLPPVPTAGVPAMVAVPFVLAVKLTPLGKAPDSLSVGTGPAVVTLNVKGVPTVEVAAAALVIDVAPVSLRMRVAPLATAVHCDSAPP